MGNGGFQGKATIPKQNTESVVNLKQTPKSILNDKVRQIRGI